MQKIVMPQERLVPILMFAGAIPFIASAIGVTLSLPAPFLSWHSICESYALVISTFMAGILWGYRDQAKDLALPLLIISNSIALLVWFSFMLAAKPVYLLVVSASFAGLLFVDLKLMRLGFLSKTYFKYRAIITSLVVISLGIVSGNGL